MRRIGTLLLILFISLITIISCKPPGQKLPIINDTSTIILDNKKYQVTYVNSYLNDNNNYVYKFKVVSSNNDSLKNIFNISQFSIHKNDKSLYTFGTNFTNKNIIGETFIVYLDNEKIDNLDLFYSKKITPNITNYLEIEILINHLFENNTLNISEFKEYSELLYISFYDNEKIIES